MLFSSQTGDLTLHAYHTSMTELIQGEEIHLRCFRVSMTIAQWPCMSVYKLVEICNSCVCPIMSHIVTVLMHTAHGGSTGTVWVCALCCVSSKRAVYSPILLWLSTVWFSGIEQWGLCVASWTAYAFRYDRTLLGTYCVCVYVQMDVSKTTNGLWTPQWTALSGISQIWVLRITHSVCCSQRVLRMCGTVHCMHAFFVSHHVYVCTYIHTYCIFSKNLSR